MSVKQKKAIKQAQKKQVKAPKKGPNKIGLAIVALLLIVVVGIIIYGFISAKSKNSHGGKNLSTTYHGCTQNPQFPINEGYTPPFAVDTRQNEDNMGLRLIEAKSGRIIKKDTWDDFGFVGQYTYDDKGNIYTSPLPYVSIDINPPELQNRILKIDSGTGEMKELINLPWKNRPSARNPYGIIAMDFDCDTKSIYATSVAGSGLKEESGRIFQVDPENKKILDTYENFDALGVQLYSNREGKRLYLGSARKPEIYSIGLKEDGSFMDDLKFECSLLDAPNGGYFKGHKIRFLNDTMIVKTREFSFSLMAASDDMRTVYRFAYDNKDKKWDFIDLFDDKTVK